MRAIEIDIDIHKLIEAERKSFGEAPNAILRRLLGLQDLVDAAAILETTERLGRAWSGDGVELPHGTLLRMTYNGCTHAGRIDDGIWRFGTKTFSSPSGAAGGLATTRKGKKTRLDGWRYFEVKRPEHTKWVLLAKLREDEGIEPSRIGKMLSNVDLDGLDFQL